MSRWVSVMGWFGLGGRALENRDGAQYAGPSTALVEDTRALGPDAALQIATVWACVSRRATTIASLPFFAYTNVNGRRQIDRTSRLWQLLHESPNRRMTPYEFWMAMMLNHDLRGNAYARIERDQKTGEALSMWPMPADQVQPTAMADGSMVFLYRVGSDVVALAEESVLHLKDLGNGTVGLPRLEYMQASSNEAQNAQWQANRVFGSSGKPTGVLMVDHVLKQEQREQLQKRFAEMATGNTARLYVLEANMKYQQLSLSPEDQQLLETRQFTVEEICRWLDVPPVLVHHSNVTTWGSGIEQIVDGFHKFTIRPMAVSIEQAVRKRVMTPAQRARMTAEFSLDALLRASLKDRMGIYSTAVQNGIYNRNECRQLENAEPYDGGEVFTAQTNLAPVDKLGEMPETTEPERDEPLGTKFLLATIEQREQAERSEATLRHIELLSAFRAAQKAPSFVVNNTVPPQKIEQTNNYSIDARSTHESPIINIPEQEPPSVTVPITVSPTPVDVHASFEATMPPPNVTVNIPPRRTDTTVQRDRDGNIEKATQVERDA